MSQNCNCENGGLANLATAKCPPRFKNVVSLFLTPLVNSAGVRNSISLTGVPSTGIDLELLTNSPDPSVRIYPIHNLENVKFPKEDTKYEEASSGRKSRIREGIQRFEAEIWEEGFQWACKLQENLCSSMGVYFLDSTGNILGINGNNNAFYPIPLDAFDPTYMFLTDDTTDKTMLKFDFAKSVNVCDYAMITSSFIDQTTSPFDLSGLFNANISKISSTSGTIVLKIYSDYFVNNPLSPSVRGIQGLTASDFTIFNVTTNTAMTVTALVANSLGTNYILTFPAAQATTGNEIKVEIGAYSIGYEGEAIIVQ